MPQAKIICLAQSKGGTSKTSSVLNIGSSLVKLGYRVLVVDVDQQASLTVSLGIDPVELPQTMRALLTDEKVLAENIVVQTAEGLDLLPSNIDLALVEFHMPAVARERVLDKKLRSLLPQYDYVLIDTPPTFSITTLNAMAASDYLLIPFQPEPLCLYGLSQLQESYEMVKNNIRPNFKLLGLFVTLYDARSRVHKGIEAKVREDWGELVFKTVIHRRLNMLDASLEGRALVSINSNSELAVEYKALTEEVIVRVQ